MAIHEVAAKGFQSAADAYEQGRPEYPPEAVACLVQELRVGPTATVLDLGAGTGKLTRLLAPTGARIIAVEPVAAMRQKLVELLPQVTAMEGTAEAIPLADASVEVVVAAQAFHWFSNVVALREIHRVLRPGGRLGLIWNVRDESVDWVTRLSEIIDPHESGVPRYRFGEWRRVFVDTPEFSALEERRFANIQEGTPEILLARVASVSYIATLPPEQHQEVLDQVRSLLATHPQIKA